MAKEESFLNPDDPKPAWRRFADEINDLIASGEYDWAFDTLHGIYETVLDLERMTANQRRAVDNILDGHERHQAGRGRRYEGFR